jgi:hypothetical protein
MQEQVFFNHEDVQVTNARFVNGGQTYAMSNITSVKATEDKPKRFWPILLFFFGVPEMFMSLWVGLALMSIAAFILFRQKTTYHVMLATAGGEVSALKTYQREYLDQIVGALNRAIVARG